MAACNQNLSVECPRLHQPRLSCQQFLHHALLDGLRLSVQHCEEVIKNSEERYPILETSYRILTTSIAEIKSDIEETQNAINQLKDEQ